MTPGREEILRCIVADDEPRARARISALAVENGLMVVGEAADGEEAEVLVARHRPDVAFLDIRMPGKDGLAVLHTLRDVADPPAVVFVTAHGDHALTAFELAAADYVVKPVDASRFALAAARAIRSVRQRKALETIDRLNRAFSPEGADRVTFRDGARLVPARLSDVIRFKACDDYVEAFLARSSHLLSSSIAALEAALPADRFVRPHRSHLVNIEHIRQAGPAGSGRMVLSMSDGEEVPVSRARTGHLVQALGGASASRAPAGPGNGK